MVVYMEEVDVARIALTNWEVACPSCWKAKLL